MRTNREGNLKRFFHIRETDSVLDVCGQALAPCEEAYDYIFWNPVGVPDKFVCVQKLYHLLANGGKLIVYFNNPYGVHAFAEGFAAPAVQNIQDKAVGYPLLSELKRAVENIGDSVYDKIYYPYPCVEFPCVFFSDDRLPEKNECDDNFYNFDTARIEAFDERYVTGAVADAGMYPYLANAYMLILSKVPMDEMPMYSRFSNERRADAQIRTDIYQEGVKKTAVTQEAQSHVLSMEAKEPELSKCLQEITIFGKRCETNRIHSVVPSEGSITFSYEKGDSLERILDSMLAQKRVQEVADVLFGFCDGLVHHGMTSDFVMTENFEKVFGQPEGWEQYSFRTLPVSDVDLICQNIILADKAVVIDYEWTFDFPVPVEFLAFRFLYFYLEAKHRMWAEEEMLSAIYEKVGITDAMKNLFLQMETNFQRYVQQGAKVLCNSYDAEGKPVLTAEEIRGKVEVLAGKTISDAKTGHTFSAKRSPEGVYLYQVSNVQGGSKILLSGFEAGEGNSKVLRLGAMMDSQGVHKGISYKTNGIHLGGLLYLYESVVPEMVLGEDEDAILAEGSANAEISVEEIAVSEAAIREWKTAVTDMRFIIDNREQQIRDLKNSASWKVTKPLRALKGNKEE